MQFEVERKSRGKWGWVLQNDDGEIIATGDEYDTAEQCGAAIELVRNSSEYPVILPRDSGQRG